ncbi:MAG TPA: translation initiation factor IF-2 N-terminal domain-containing protein [Acidimicrobiia bacterium]
MRVYELARELGVASRQVLEHTEQHDMGRKTASSNLDQDQAELIRCAFAEVDRTAPDGLSHGPDGIESAAERFEKRMKGQPGPGVADPTMAAPSTDTDEVKQKQLGDLELYRRLSSRARPWWRHILAIFLLGLLSTPLALLTPVPVKIVVDSVLGDQPLPDFLTAIVPDDTPDVTVLLLAAGLAMAVAVLIQLRDLGSSLLQTYAGERMVLDFRAELVRHMQRLSFSYSDKVGTADLLYRIQYDAPAIQWLPMDVVIPSLTAMVTVASMMYVAARIDLELAVVALLVIPPLVAVLVLMRRRMRRRSHSVKQLESSALFALQEGLGAIRVVKAFAQEHRERERFVSSSLLGVDRRLRLVAAEGGYGVLVAVITAAGTGAILFIGARHVQAGVLTLGNLLLILGYLTQLYGPLRAMSHRAVRLQAHLASAERAFAVLDEIPDVIEQTDAMPLHRATGEVVFDHVTFEYEKGRPVLADITLEIPAGVAVGISGVTGVGKTTLLGLLTRFYDPAKGRVLLDGVNLRDYRLADLRNQFAIVLQEPVLFSSSIGENIAYGRPGASQREIVSAARAAGVHGFIEDLPEGYETPVGERGMRLSGGERQRISLARAFLKDAPILILDEPTSSVDLSTEGEIVETLADLVKGRTSFVVAHRPSTLELCDLRIEIEGGRVGSIVARIA